MRCEGGTNGSLYVLFATCSGFWILDPGFWIPDLDRPKLTPRYDDDNNALSLAHSSPDWIS